MSHHNTRASRRLDRRVCTQLRRNYILKVSGEIYCEHEIIAGRTYQREECVFILI